MFNGTAVTRPCNISSPSPSAQPSRCQIQAKSLDQACFQRRKMREVKQDGLIMYHFHETKSCRLEMNTRLQVPHSVSGTQTASWRSLLSTCHTVSRYTCKYNFIYSTKSRDFSASTSQLIYLCTYVFTYLLFQHISLKPLINIYFLLNSLLYRVTQKNGNF